MKSIMIFISLFNNNAFKTKWIKNLALKNMLYNIYFYINFFNHSSKKGLLLYKEINKTTKL